VRYLALDEVLALHAEQVRRFGGAAGLRDPGLLESAVAMPRATFDGEALHPTPFEAGAACLFHLARNHPFVDGNKRVALAAALVFLWLNGWRVETDDDSLTGLVVGVASGAVAKSEIAVYLQRHAERRA
jgi:death on curing protein